jgi:hypothetical protein
LPRFVSLLWRCPDHGAVSRRLRHPRPSSFLPTHQTSYSTGNAAVRPHGGDPVRRKQALPMPRENSRPDGRSPPGRRRSGADPTLGWRSTPSGNQRASSEPARDLSPTLGHRLGVLPVNQIISCSTGKPDTWCERRDGGGWVFGTGRALTGAGAFGWACGPRTRGGAARTPGEPPNSPRDGPGRA